MASEKALTFDLSKKVVGGIDSADTLIVGAGIKAASSALSISPNADSTAAIVFTNAAGTTIGSIDTTNKRLRIGDAVAPTATLHLAPGTNVAGTAPIKLTSGTALGTIEDGAIEYHGSHLYFSIGGTRYQLDQQAGGTLVGLTLGVSPWTTALGVGAANVPPTGTYNTLLGFNAGLLLGVGNQNVVVGALAGDAMVNTSNCVVVGYNAASAMTGSWNTILGSSAAPVMVGGSENVVAGYQAGNTLSTGVQNVLIGVQTGTFMTAHSGTVYIGYQAGWATTPGQGCVGIGYQAMQYGTSGSNVGIGYMAMQAGVGASYGVCVAVGYQAMRNITSSTFSVAIGGSAGYNLSSGSNNSFLGYNAGRTITTGSSSTTIGAYAGYSLVGATAGATAIGAYAQYQYTGTNCTSVGFEALDFGNGATNTAVGYQSMKGAAGSTGIGNATLGRQALFAYSSASDNVAIGASAASTLTTGSGNVYLGSSTIASAVGVSNEIVIGFNLTGKGANTGLIKSNTLYFGDGVDGIKTLYANDVAGTHGLRYNNGTSAWELNNGGGWVAIGTGGGLPACTINQVLQGSGTNTWAAVSDITLANDANRAITVATAPTTVAGRSITITGGAALDTNQVGGAASIIGGPGVGSGAGGNANLTGAAAVGTGAAGDAAARGGASASAAAAGDVRIFGGDNSSSGAGGNVNIRGGLSTSGTAGVVALYNSVQFASPLGASAQIDFKPASGSRITSDIAFSPAANHIVYVAPGDTQRSLTIVGQAAISAATAGGSVSLIGGVGSTSGGGGNANVTGAASSGSGTAGDAAVRGGASSSTGTAGDVRVFGGDNSSSGDGGNVNIRGGLSTSGTAGVVALYNAVQFRSPLGVSAQIDFNSPQTTIVSSMTFGGNADRTIYINPPTAAGNGAKFTLEAGHANTSGDGGDLVLSSGASAGGGANVDGNVLITMAGGATVAALFDTMHQRVRIGDGTAPTAKLHVAAGAAAADSAPVKLTSGTLLSTPEAGALEYNGTAWYITNGAGTRTAIPTSSSGAPSVWNAIAGVVSTAPGIGQITVTTDLRNTVKVGMPLRVQDATGIEYDEWGQVSAYSGLTGVGESTLDSSGTMYGDIVDDGGGFYHLDLYKRQLTSPRTAADKIGHTASYNTTGVKAIVADNASGLGGTLNIQTASRIGEPYVEFWKWYVISAITDTTITVLGPPLGTAAGMIQNVWYGPPSNVQQMRVQMDGSLYSKENYYQLTEWWAGPRARFVHMRSVVDIVGAAGCTLNIRYHDGGDILTTDTDAADAFGTDNEITPSRTLYTFGDDVAVMITGGGQEEDQWAGLVVKTVWVLE